MDKKVYEKPSKSTGRPKGSKITDLDIIASAHRFSTRSEFAYGDKSAYEMARIRGLLKIIFPNTVQKQWSEQDVRDAAKNFTTRTEFAKKCGSAYNAARRMGILDELMDSTMNVWDKVAVMRIAVNCSSKKQLKQKNPTAYNAALRLNIIDEIFENQSGKTNTRDCVYIWKVKGETNLYKVGITSESISHHRITQVSQESKFDIEWSVIEKVGYSNAKVIERFMKQKGTVFPMSKKFYGYSEFRVMSAEEVNQCLNMIKEYRLTRGM